MPAIKPAELQKVLANALSASGLHWKAPANVLGTFKTTVTVAGKAYSFDLAVRTVMELIHFSGACAASWVKPQQGASFHS